MFINLYLISRACWDILAKEEIDIENTDLPVYLDLLDQIYDLHPQMDPDKDFKLLWKYTAHDLLPINDFITFNTLLKLSDNDSIYVLINDVEENYKDTRYFLRKLDKEELISEKLEAKSKYDVTFPSKEAAECICSVIAVEEPDIDVDISDKEIIEHALRHEPVKPYWTADYTIKFNVIEGIKKAMKGEIINCSPHKDIYFLETNTKNESTDLANLFAPPTGGDVFKYKPRLKLKQKVNPALEFFIQNKPRNPSLDQTSNKSGGSYQDDAKCPHPGSSGALGSCRRRRSSIDLYEEAASILGLTCAQTDDCKCLECQCHYFDFEEEIDFPTGGECLVEVDHSSSCSIQ